MKQTDFKYYINFPSNSVTLSSVPKSVRKSVEFKNLIDAQIIDTVKSGRGRKITVKKPDAYSEFISTYFPDATNDRLSKSANIRKYRNSKARKTISPSVFLVRGFKSVSIGNKIFDLKAATDSFGLFALSNPDLIADKICFVENLDSFLKAEKIIGKDFTFLHRYGRIGVESIQAICASEIVVFVDYDFNGLAEFLRIKSVFPNSILFVPDNFNELFERYSVQMNGRQKASKAVSESSDPTVQMINELVSKTNRFLEQEILTDD